MPKEVQPSFVRAVEMEELCIRVGLQDAVIQVAVTICSLAAHQKYFGFKGSTIDWMDFNHYRPWSFDSGDGRLTDDLKNGK